MSGSLLRDFFEALSGGLARARDEWQLLVIVLALGCAWLVARVVKYRIDARLKLAAPRQAGADVLKLSVEGTRRLIFPAAAWLLLWLGAQALRLSGVVTGIAGARLLHLALALVTALAVVRLVVYALRRALVNVALIGAFERAIGLVAWAVLALYVTGVLGDVTAWLNATEIPVGKTRVSLGAVLSSVTATLASLLVAMWIGSLIESRLMDTPGLNRNFRVLLGRVARAVLMTVAVLVALGVSGIDLTVLSVFGGALGVGLGLGLQRVASNYVSGFILLLERSLRIGDLVTVAGTLDRYNGTVSQIGTRYTLLKSTDGNDIVVPNELLVSAPVVNHSLAAPSVRLTVRLAISYESDLDLALRLGEEAARATPQVLAEPAPAALLVDFGVNGPLLEIGFSVGDPTQGLNNVKSQVGVALQRAYVQHRIKIVGR